MNRNITKPYGYQPLEYYSQEQLEDLRKALWDKPEKYLDYKNSLTMSFHNLTYMDNLIFHYLDKSLDITPVISIADWSQNSLSKSKFLSEVLKKSATYYIKTNQHIYNANNAELLLENFILYTNELRQDKRNNDYVERVYYEVLPDFCEKMIYGYNYHDSIANIEEKGKFLNLFKKSYALFRDNFKDKDTIGSRSCALVAATLLTRKKIDLNHEVLQLLLPEIDIKSIWKNYKGFIFHKLFEVGLKTDGFKILEHLMSPIGEDEIFKEVLNNFYHKPREKLDKTLYYLERNWHLLDKDKSIDYMDRFFKLNNYNKLEFDLEYIAPLIKVMTPLDRLEKIFSSKYIFTEEIKQSKGYQMCCEELEKRRLYNILEKDLPQKAVTKQIKI